MGSTSTADRSDEMARRYARTGARADRDRLIGATLDLADATAWRYADRGETIDDLRQVARLGLVRAADRYRPERGAFPAFATATIRGELRRHFRDTTWAVHVPRRTQELVPRVRRCAERLQQDLGRSPSPQEIATELGLPLARVLESYAADAAYQVTSIEDDRHDGLPDLRVIDEVDELLDLRRALATMCDRDRLLLELRFGDELTQSAIAERIGVSQVHVSRLLSRATDRMRMALAAG